MTVTKFNAVLIIIKQMHNGLYWHIVLYWRLMGPERDAQSLSIPLETVPPYCNFLFESYLEQPESALQRSLTSLLLLTCCYFISLSIALSPHFPLPPRLCNGMISILRRLHREVTQTFSQLSRCQSAGWSVWPARTHVELLIPLLGWSLGLLHSHSFS